MKKKLTIFSLAFLAIFAEDRRPLENFIHGDAFRAMTDLRYEDKYVESWVKPTPSPFLEMKKEGIWKKVKPGDIVFVGLPLLKRFFEEVHPKINHPYILISHNGDENIGSEFDEYLEEGKIIKWFSQNVNHVHEKLIPIPIGIENRYWLSRKMSSFSTLRRAMGITRERSDSVYLNINVATYPAERRKVQRAFRKKPFVVAPGKKMFFQYLMDLKKNAFCLSPSGNGIDCHRTWEALLMGSIPIIRPHVKASKTHAKGNEFLYEGLPVIVVKNWACVNESFLSEKKEGLYTEPLLMEKIFFPYWRDLILREQAQFLSEL